MSTTNTPENKGETVPDSRTPSDARIILGPLVKYALMGLVLVSVIISTAVLLDSQFNDIDQAARLDKRQDYTYTAADTRTTKVAETMNEASDSQAAKLPQRPIAVAPAIDSKAVLDSTEHVESTAAISSQTPTIETRNDTLPVAAAPVATAVIQPRENSNTDATTVVTDSAVKDQATADKYQRYAYPFEPSFDALIAERNAYLNKMDQIYLEELKVRQLKQLQHMRERLARQEQRIKEWEARYQQRYDVRASDVEERQETRDRLSADRI